MEYFKECAKDSGMAWNQSRDSCREYFYFAPVIFASLTV